jgi:hypothetical protein
MNDPRCVGIDAIDAKPAGLSACAPVPGGKFGVPTYFDWFDRFGQLFGARMH